MSKAFAFVAAALLVAAGGCSSARMSDREADGLFRQGKYDEAAAHLRKGLEKEGDGRDQLLYLLDLGLALHSAGKYDESIKVFREADRIADIKDYTSLSKEAATLLTTDQIKDYKGEDFENILINTYLAMNYACIGNVEDALVEARRVNRKIHMMVQDGGRKYKQNAFARYLSAILYESEKNYNDAYLDYKFAQELEPEYPGIGKDLWRAAMLNGMRDQAETWAKKYKLSDDDKKAAMLSSPKSGKGEIIVLYENGISPIKKPHPSFYQVPKFFPRENHVLYANVDVGGVVQPTARLMNIEAVAIENLDEKWGGILAKKIAGVVAKEVAANQIEKHTDSALLGAAARILFYASDQADTRSWNLLPQSLQLARFVVEPGTHTVKAMPVGAEALPEKTVQVKAGKKAFVTFRYMP